MKKIKLWSATLICLLPLAVSCSMDSSPPSNDEVKALVTERLKGGFNDGATSKKYSQIQSVEITNIMEEVPGERYHVDVNILGTCEAKGLLGGKTVGPCNLSRRFKLIREGGRWTAYSPTEKL